MQSVTVATFDVTIAIFTSDIIFREKKRLLAEEMAAKEDLLGDNRLPALRPAHAPNKKTVRGICTYTIIAYSLILV